MFIFVWFSMSACGDSTLSWKRS